MAFTTTIRVPNDLHARIRERAEQLGVSRNMLWLKAMEHYLEEGDTPVDSIIFSKTLGGMVVQIGTAANRYFLSWGIPRKEGAKVISKDYLSKDGGIRWFATKQEAVDAVKQVVAATVRVK